MSASLLIVDGSNMLMRSAFGGDYPPEEATGIATGLINRAVRQVNATHLIIALDDPSNPSWRKQMFPAYKANRTVDTGPWIVHALTHWQEIGWKAVICKGYEADDIIATLAIRARKNARVIVLSGDSDLLVLTADEAEFIKPVNGGQFEAVIEADVMKKYDLESAQQLPDFKALVGEVSDNVPGVPGIGRVKAAALLRIYPSLEFIITAGKKDKAPKNEKAVADAEDAARLALRLVTLSYNAPVELIKPSECRT